MQIELTRAERERLQQYAQAHGLATLEDALKHAAHAELERRYRLPTRQASVVPIQGLKSPRSSE